MTLRILSGNGALQIMPFRKLGRKCHFFPRFCTRKRSKTYADIGHHKHTDEEKDSMDRDFTFEEFAESLKQMENGRSPSCDGLLVDFYKIFFGKISRILWEFILYSHELGYLHPSARKGIISVIPKKTRNPLLIRNWRPLTLLNVDHKIVSKMIANRLKEHIHNVIGPQQTGYMPGKYIGANIRKIIDILSFLEDEHIQAVLIQIDFEKCFDSIEHEPMYAALKFFNVGDGLISWIKIIYCEFTLCVTNNGYASRYLAQERGLHQGPGLSGIAFLYCAELMTAHIKANNKIRGV